MSEQQHAQGDEVWITTGDFAGVTGTVVWYDATQRAYVILPDGQENTALVAPPEIVAARGTVPPGTQDRSDVPEFGMTSEDLAEYVGNFIGECVTRVKGVGNEQYDRGSHQKFEEMPVDALFEYAEEEVRDLAVYAAMLHIRLNRIRHALRPRL